MTYTEKADFFLNCLDNYYCSLSMFLENYGKSDYSLKKELEKCQNEKDIKRLINNYI